MTMGRIDAQRKSRVIFAVVCQLVLIGLRISLSFSFASAAAA